MKKKRRKYSQEFKEEAVKLVTEQGYNLTEASRNLGIHENLLAQGKPVLQQRIPRDIEGP